jgi:hypothetical protein
MTMSAMRLLRRATMANAAALVLCASIIGCGPAAHAGGAVCITGDIGVGGVEPGTCLNPGELDALLDKPVQQGPNRSAAFKMTDPDDMSKQANVATCRDYETRKKEDWYALSNLDLAKEGWFQRTCGTIALLEDARPSKRSYLDDPDAGLSDPKLISASILPSADEGLASVSDKTLADLVAGGSVKINSASRRQLDLTYEGLRAVYDEIARGDFDHDGVEDILVFMGVHSTGGTLKWYQHLGLSRKSAGSPLQLVLNEGV